MYILFLLLQFSPIFCAIPLASATSERACVPSQTNKQTDASVYVTFIINYSYIINTYLFFVKRMQKSCQCAATSSLLTQMETATEGQERSRVRCLQPIDKPVTSNASLQRTRNRWKR